MKETTDSAGIETKAAAQAIGGQNPPWKARSVWIATLLAVIGAVFWAKDAAQTSAQPSTAATPGLSGFAASGPQTGNRQDQQVSAKPSTPATFRLGVSYLGGFFLGWAFRRFLKATLVVSGAVFVVIVLAKKLGGLNFDWASVEGHVRSSLTWLQGEAGTIKQFLTGYLPSAGAAGVGAFFGFRRK